MPNKFRAGAKTQIRKAVRRMGYDLVPLAAGVVEVQRRILADIGAVIDVGANVGQYGERLRDIGYSGRIVSFEPSGAAFDILAAKVARDDKWIARQCALGAETGEATLNVSANSVSSSLLTVGDTHLRAAPSSRTTSTEIVSVSTLDDELRNVDGPLYLKLDIQGFELPALRGAVKVLDTCEAVQCELSFDALYEGQSAWLEVCELLQSRGFVVRYIEPGYEDSNTRFMLQADVIMTRRSSTT
jgi:FkbM family methyltransferase